MYKFFTIILIFTFIACNKKDVISKTLNESLLGKWALTHYNYIQSGTTTTVNVPCVNNFWNFSDTNTNDIDNHIVKLDRPPTDINQSQYYKINNDTLALLNAAVDPRTGGMVLAPSEYGPYKIFLIGLDSLRLESKSSVGLSFESLGFKRATS